MLPCGSQQISTMKAAVLLATAAEAAKQAKRSLPSRRSRACPRAAKLTFGCRACRAAVARRGQRGASSSSAAARPPPRRSAARRPITRPRGGRRIATPQEVPRRRPRQGDGAKGIETATTGAGCLKAACRWSPTSSAASLIPVSVTHPTRARPKAMSKDAATLDELRSRRRSAPSSSSSTSA